MHFLEDMTHCKWGSYTCKIEMCRCNRNGRSSTTEEWTIITMKHEHFGDSCTLSHSQSVSEWFACVRNWPTLLSMFYGVMWNRGTDVKARVFTPTSTQYRYTKQSISTTCFSVGMRCTCTFLHAASVQWQKRRWAPSGTDSKPNHIFQFCVGVTDSQPT